MAQQVAMMVARVLHCLMGYSPPTLAMASSQLLAVPWEIILAVLKAATMGSPRVGAMIPSLTRVDNGKPVDSCKPIILLRAVDSGTSTTVVVEVVKWVGEVT